MSSRSLSLELLTLIISHLHNDLPSLKACSLASKLLCQLATVHIFHRMVYEIDVATWPIDLFLQATSSARLQQVKELVLSRKDPEENDDQGRAGKDKDKSKRKKSKAGLVGQHPKAPPPPSEGHLNFWTLHQLVSQLPHLRSLTIARLHFGAGPPRVIQSLLAIEELHFQGVDTAHTFFDVLGLFSSISTLSISDHWNSFIVPMGPVRLLPGLPYMRKDNLPSLKVDTFKIASCMPKVVHYWFKAFPRFMGPNYKIKMLWMDESLFLFEGDRKDALAALREVVGHIEGITLDMAGDRAIYLPEHGVLLPPLYHASFLTTVHIRISGTQRGIRAVQKIILSTRNYGNNTNLQSLREIYITVVFPRKEGETDEKAVIRVRCLHWELASRALITTGWDSDYGVNGRFVQIRVVNEREELGGTGWLRDLLPKALYSLQHPKTRAFFRYG